MKYVRQPPHQLGRLECSDARPWTQIRHPVIMAAMSKRVLSLVDWVRGFLCVFLGIPASGCHAFTSQLGKLRLWEAYEFWLPWVFQTELGSQLDCSHPS